MPRGNDIKDAFTIQALPPRNDVLAVHCVAIIKIKLHYKNRSIFK
ncbi:hypothetical protein [Rickettsia endosymbiont of Orchestes rusci]